MRLIDADALEELFREVIGNIAKRPEIDGALEHMVRASAMTVEMIKDAETIHAVPVVECEWERMKDERDILCSVCKARFNPDIRFLTDSQIRYCPHCGAKVVKVRWT